MDSTENHQMCRTVIGDFSSYLLCRFDFQLRHLKAGLAHHEFDGKSAMKIVTRVDQNVF